MALDTHFILKQFDEQADCYCFPMLDNGYYYHGDQKLTIFRDEKRWAMTIEVLAYNNHEYGLQGITTVSYTLGNCILTEKLNDNDNFFVFAKDNGAGTFLLEDNGYISYLNSNAKTILIKDKVIDINPDRQFYLSKNGTLEYPDKITPKEFMRGLIPEQSSFFWVDRQEIAKKIPLDLTALLTIDNWFHPTLLENKDRVIQRHFNN